jgi:hypothetical protein
MQIYPKLYKYKFIKLIKLLAHYMTNKQKPATENPEPVFGYDPN